MKIYFMVPFYLSESENDTSVSLFIRTYRLYTQTIHCYGYRSNSH